MLRNLLIYFALLSLPFSSFAQSPVWRVEKNGHFLFLGGTIHLLSKDDYPLPEAFSQAFAQSDLLVFETDTLALQQPAFHLKLMSGLMYPPGEALSDDLDTATLDLLKAYLQAHQLSFEQFSRFRPSLLSTTLTVMELKRLGYNELGVDQYFSQKALERGVPLGSLETVEEQIQYLALMGQGKENELIRMTLGDLDSLPEIIASIKSAWRQGEMDALELNALNMMVAEYPDIYTSLIVERNRRWLSKIRAMLDNPTTEFILVGALHLAGQDGLIQQLQTEGFSVTQLP